MLFQFGPQLSHFERHMCLHGKPAFWDVFSWIKYAIRHSNCARQIWNFNLVEANPIGESGNWTFFFQGILSISEEIWSGAHSESSNGRMFNKLSISFPWINRETATDIEFILKQWVPPLYTRHWNGFCSWQKHPHGIEKWIKYNNYVILDLYISLEHIHWSCKLPE